LQKNGPNYDWLKAKSICETLVDNTNANFALQLVYGCAGMYVVLDVYKDLCTLMLQIYR